MSRIIDGTQIAQDVRRQARAEVDELKKSGIFPGLATVVVGDDPASAVYVRNKVKACNDVGIYSQHRHLPAGTGEAELLAVIHALNQDDRIHGILVQLPLPAPLDEDKVLEAISPAKDVDGLHPWNQGLLQLGRGVLIPCTPLGVVEMLHRSGARVEGAHVVVVGRSRLVGMPLAILLAQKSAGGNATVTICHSKSTGLADICRQADILVAAIGKPAFIGAGMVKQGAVVIDVGINRVVDASAPKGHRLVGDVDFDAVRHVAGMITPVPGGVGPMTIAMLLRNCVVAARRNSLRQ